MDSAGAWAGWRLDHVTRSPRSCRRLVSVRVAAAASEQEGCATVSAREAILGRLRTARAAARLPRSPVAAPGSGALQKGLPPASREALCDRFATEARALGVDCWIESTPEAVRARVISAVTGLRVYAWDADTLPYDAGSLVPDAATAASSRAIQAAADVGLTGCAAAIAETASLVMLEGPGRPRAASLLPPVHVALVRVDDLHGTMADYFTAHAEAMAGSSSCTFITGPSRTADIELTLTLGIHGPGRVVVIIGP
jgi:L-lactate dehydrogenase complex protein LldG